jgi:hydrogenase-4 membrane subunit HyfE
MEKVGFANWANSIVKKFTIIDIFLIELSSLAFGVLLTALIPSLIEINIWWIVIAVVILAIKPTIKAFSK